MKTLEQLKSEFYDALISHGVSEKESNETAEIFTSNAADGVLSHSVRRFPRLLKNIEDGIVKPGIMPVLVSSFSALERYDAGCGIGTTSASFAMQRACELAVRYGIGAVALKNANHWMRAGYYGLLAAKNGMVGICWTNTMPNMCAWGTAEAVVGNNPFVIAVPRANGKHFIFDSSQAQFSYGKLEEYRLKNKDLPVDGGYDSEFRLTRNAAEIEKTRRVLPAGFWKGSSMSILLDAAVTMLSDGQSVNMIGKNGNAETGLSQFFIAINPEVLGSENWEEKAKQIEESLHNATPMWDNPARYPGERAFYTREKSRAEGIDL